MTAGVAAAPKEAGLQPYACGLQPHACGLQPHACRLQPYVCGLQLLVCGLQPHACVRPATLCVATDLHRAFRDSARRDALCSHAGGCAAAEWRSGVGGSGMIVARASFNPTQSAVAGG